MFPIASNTDDPRITYVDDVFSTYLYTGNGSPQTINNGIDLAGKGGLVWMKGRSGEYAAYNHSLHDTQRGLVYRLSTNNTNAQSNEPADINSFNSNGFTLGGGALTNDPSTTYTAWTFRKAAKFFDVQTVSHANGLMDTNINLSVLGTVGMVIAKNTSLGGDWIVWHRGLTAGNNSRLNTTAAQSTTNAWLSVSGTTATLSVNAPSGTYVIYAYAHDTAADGLIQCGMATYPTSGDVEVNLGWQPQYVLYKDSGHATNWTILDTMRGWSAQTTGGVFSNSTGGAAENLYANTSDAATAIYGSLTSTGFKLSANDNYGDGNTKVIYMAIRRPNKPPTSGTQVFAPVAIIGGVTNKVAVTSSVNAPDTAFSFARGNPYSLGAQVRDRLCSNGKSYIQLESTGTEVNYSAYTNGFSNLQNGIDGANAGSTFNYSSPGTIYWMFKRAPGFFDVVCYTGTGSATTFAHNLGVPPEMIIVKRRTVSSADWTIYHSTMGATKYTYLDGSTELTGSTYWNNTPPTSTVFTVGTDYHVNYAANTYVAFLFATLAGISKVGGYTGNGSSQNIDCGFASGARFILIHRIDSGSNNWYCWDTARGIVTGNDGRISLNSATAEVTTDDSVDPYSPGFTVNQLAATNINVTSATYIYLAVA